MVVCNGRITLQLHRNLLRHWETPSKMSCQKEPHVDDTNLKWSMTPAESQGQHYSLHGMEDVHCTESAFHQNDTKK